jgi:hypothetical protein
MEKPLAPMARGFCLLHIFPLPLWERIEVRGSIDFHPHPALLPSREKAEHPMSMGLEMYSESEKSHVLSNAGRSEETE